MDAPDLLGLGVFESGDDVSLRLFNGPSYAPLALVIGASPRGRIGPPERFGWA